MSHASSGACHLVQAVLGAAGGRALLGSLSFNWSESVIAIACSLETVPYSPRLLDATVPAWVVLKIFFLYQPPLLRINKNVFELSQCYFPFRIKFHLDAQNWSRGDWKCVNLTAESSRLLLYCPKSSQVKKQQIVPHFACCFSFSAFRGKQNKTRNPAPSPPKPLSPASPSATGFCRDPPAGAPLLYRREEWSSSWPSTRRDCHEPWRWERFVQHLPLAADLWRFVLLFALTQAASFPPSCSLLSVWALQSVFGCDPPRTAGLARPRPGLRFQQGLCQAACASLPDGSGTVTT